MTGFPVVLKVDVPSIIHKSDVGGVVMNLNTTDAVVGVFEQLQGRVQDHFTEGDRFVTILKQADLDGQEVILGIKQDASFGQVLFFGLGGIFTVITSIKPIDHL